ncbi:MAG: hypothetical protein ACLR4Z_05665 [Butyricicoccaceae bacterium]
MIEVCRKSRSPRRFPSTERWFRRSRRQSRSVRKPVIIGERINPTGKSKFKAALRENNIEYILGEGMAQEDSGAHILDVNVGLPEINEPLHDGARRDAPSERYRPAAPDRHLEHRGNGTRHASGITASR